MPEKWIKGIAATRMQRIKRSTAEGGIRELSELPESYRDENADWETVKSVENPFEQLYLHYRAWDVITTEMITGNYAILSEFWTRTLARARSSTQVAKKYGGDKALSNYPDLLKEAHAQLTADGGPRRCFEAIVESKRAILRHRVDDWLMAGAYTPEIGAEVKAKGREVDLTDEEINSCLADILKSKGWVPETERTDNPFSVAWGPPKKDTLKPQNDFDAFVTEFLVGNVYQGDISLIEKKSRDLGLPEGQAIKRFEQTMRSKGMSPDAKDVPDDIRSTLSLVWKTEEEHRKHREEQRKKDLEIEEQTRLDATGKFTELLDNNLANGLYRPSDYVNVKRIAPEYLKRNVTALDETLIQYLKQKRFKPVKSFPPGAELSVEWKIPKGHWLRNVALVVFSGLFILALYLSAIKWLSNRPASLSVSSVPSGATLTVDGKTKGQTPVSDIKITPGDHNITLKKKGLIAEQALSIKAGEKKEIIIALISTPPPNGKGSPQPGHSVAVAPPPSPFAELHIASTPAGASVAIDGQKKGTTPITITAAPGQHTVVISKNGFETSYDQIGIRGGEKKTFSYSLAEATKPNPAGGGGGTDIVLREREISAYLEEGKKYYSMGKYELCVDKLREVLKRDVNNQEAMTYITMAKNKLEEIDRQFKNPDVGRSR